MKDPTVFSEKTLVPIGTLIILCGAIAWITLVYADGKTTKDDLKEFKDKMEYRLEKMDGKLEKILDRMNK